MKKATVYMCMLLVLMALGAAEAATKTETFPAQVGPTSLDWTQNLIFSTFNPSLGTLTGVTISLHAYIAGYEEIESFNNSASTVVTTILANVKVELPDTSTIAVLKPTFTATDSLTAYDGLWDWGGTSGRSRPYAADDSALQTYTSQTDLAPFIGTGSISLPVVAQGTSDAAGSANLSTYFAATSGATVTATYTYIDLVPEPASLLVLGAGALAVVGALLRRRK